jgi:CSLREA domain-containing protein
MLNDSLSEAIYTGKATRNLTLGLLVMIIFGVLAASSADAATTFTVNSTGDAQDFNLEDGRCFTGATSFGAEVCTLRAAIEQANATNGPDEIHFGILAFRDGGCNSVSGVCTITPASGLPAIEDPVVIDGYTQPGAAENTLARGTNADLRIVLSGAQVPVDTSAALEIFTSDVTVRGLIINRWTSRSGVWIDGRDTDLGSVTADSNKIEGSFIGTNPSGTQDLGNGIDGVSLFEARNTTVGGTTRAARNVISGNHTAGVRISESSVKNMVQGNLIGTTASGTSALGNDREGVNIVRASGNTVGGTSSPAARNVISANGFSGVQISGDAGFQSGGNKVQGNLIGTAVNGVDALGNSSDGVSVVDSSSNVIGGAASARNIIAFNQDIGVGVYVVDFPANGNRVLSDSIHSNGELGIDLVSGIPGATPNDLKDPDSGPNGFQNKPVLSSATTTRSSIIIRGNLNSTPQKTFTIQFFSNSSGNEGRTLLGQKSVTTNANGNAPFAFTFAKAVPAGQVVTATSTGSAGTSEFSGPRTVVAQ